MPDARDPTGFDQFWSTYPRKVGKLAALREWNKLQPPIADVLAALDWQVRAWDDPQFIPHPRTYLHQGRWMDEPDERFLRREAVKNYEAPVQRKYREQFEAENPDLKSKH